MRVLITATPESEGRATSGTSSRQFLLNSLALAGSDEVEVVSDPSAADVIIFAEWHGDEQSPDDVQRVVTSPLYREFGRKVVIHSGKDDPRPLVPGLYPSLAKGWMRSLGCQGAPYLQPTNPLIGTDVGWDGSLNFLASFVGACEGKQVRLDLLRQSRRADWRDILVRDTHSEFVRTAQQGAEREHRELKRLFTVNLMAAKFALCPGGTGPSSFRIFEAMQAGRPPVILSDSWSPPPGPNWNSFAIQIAQREMRHIPELLSEREGEWAGLGAKASAAWAEWYSPERIGLTISRQALEIASARRRRTISVASMTYVHGVRSSRRTAHRLAAKANRIVKKVLS